MLVSAELTPTRGLRGMRPPVRPALPPAAALAAALSARASAGAAAPAAALPAEPREPHLADVVQLTHGGQNAEAYWSPDGRELIFQSTRAPYACDQIFRMPADGSGAPALVSTGKGRTTCSYFTPDGRVLFSSTHAAGDACPPPADRSQATSGRSTLPMRSGPRSRTAATSAG